MGKHYEDLDSYKSYDFQWLGPILYPLTLAILCQLMVFSDMIRHSCTGSATSCLVPRTARLKGTAPPPDARVTSLVLIVILSESSFAVLCLAQCIINYSTRSFYGGSSACDLQAFYATYYSFSS